MSIPSKQFPLDLDCISNPPSPKDDTLKPFPILKEEHLRGETIDIILELADRARFGLTVSFSRNGHKVDATLGRQWDYYDAVRIFRTSLAKLDERNQSETPIDVIVRNGLIKQMNFKWFP